MSARPPEHRIESYPHAEPHAWEPRLPEGRIERIYTHWSGGDYETVYPAYHVCIARRSDGGILVVETHDPRANMRDVYAEPDAPYAPHTYQRNSFALGIAIMAMRDATPANFGAFPLTPESIDALCLVAAKLAAHYRVPVEPEYLMSHAEAAIRDGYFGHGDDERWDIARLQPNMHPLAPHDALATGDELRRRTRDYLR